MKKVKLQKAIAAFLTVSMTASMVLTGCGSTAASAPSTEASKASEKASEAPAQDTAETSAAVQDTAAAPQVSHDSELEIEIYDVASNFQGEQTGWFAKILKDKFNIKLNIIAPQVAGDASSLYQTRCAAGNLGDIVILDNADMQDCIEAGLVADIGKDIGSWSNLMKYNDQITAFNSAMDGVNAGSIYAIPCEMNSNGPTEYMEDTVYTCPRVLWNNYTEQGSPDLKNLDDLLALLQKIQTAHPKNDAGDNAYAITLWPDWDNTSMECVNQLTKWYGQEVNGSILLGTDNSIKPLTDKDGAYYKMLNFLYKAQKMGLVDPDSATQDWNAACDKMKQGRVGLLWYSWQYGFTNSPENGEKGQNYAAIPIADMNVYQASDTYYGDGRVWGIGSGVSDENKARILEFLDWLASPEGLTLQHDGTEGLIYTVNDDGTYTMTDDGLNRYSKDITVPDDMGGGLWQDGNDQINQWIISSYEINPNTKETYTSNLWASYIKANQTKTTTEWQSKFGADNEVKYFENNGQMNIVASINKPLAIDDTDTSLIRSECGKEICADSWKMVFASSDDDFNSMWDDMCTQLNGLGWDQLVQFDTDKYQVVVDARKAAK